MADKKAKVQYEEEDEFTCQSCDAEFTLVYYSDQDGIIYSPEFCPFCGEHLDVDDDDEDEEEEYIDED